MSRFFGYAGGGRQGARFVVDLESSSTDHASAMARHAAS
jgi:hypothetical protein